MIKILLPVVTFVLGAILSPALEILGTKTLNRYGPFAEVIRFDTCLPLHRSVVLIRDVATAEPLLTVPVQALNNASFFIENNLAQALRKVEITATPITGANYQPNILQAQILTNAIAEAPNYAVERAGAALQISIPTWGVGDAIMAQVKLDQPVAYIIEVYSEDYSQRVIFEPGCEAGAYTMTHPPVSVFQYNTPDCDASKRDKSGHYSCEVKTSEFEIPEGIRSGASELQWEYIIQADR